MDQVTTETSVNHVGTTKHQRYQQKRWDQLTRFLAGELKTIPFGIYKTGQADQPWIVIWDTGLLCKEPGRMYFQFRHEARKFWKEVRTKVSQKTC